MGSASALIDISQSSQTAGNIVYTGGLNTPILLILLPNFLDLKMGIH